MSLHLIYVVGKSVTLLNSMYKHIIKKHVSSDVMKVYAFLLLLTLKHTLSSENLS